LARFSGTNSNLNRFSGWVRNGRPRQCGGDLACFLESKMSLYAVMQPTIVQAVHCQDEPIHGRPGRWQATQTQVATRVGRRYKNIGGAIKLADKVGGWVTDLNSGRIVHDSASATA
jgi:hypothetical protein